MRLLIIATCVLLSACAASNSGYRQPPPSLVEPGSEALDNRATYLELIARMQQQGAYYASLAHIEACRQRFGDSPRLRLLQADALLRTGQHAQAGALYESLTRTDQAAAAWHGLGRVAVHGGQHAQAEAAFARAVSLQPLDTDYLGDLGYLRLQAGQTAQAREPLAKALELSPGNARAAANMAVWALLQGDAATAERLMQQGQLGEDSRRAVHAQLRELQQTTSSATSSLTSSARSPAQTQAATTGSTRSTAPLPATMLERFATPPASPEGQRPERTP